MKKIITLLSLFTLCLGSFSQVYIDEFDDDVVGLSSEATGFTYAESNGETTITGDGSSGPWDVFSYPLLDGAGAPISLDVTENNKIFVRAKASNLGTQLRMDVVDELGFASTVPGITKTMVNDYVVFEYDYSGVYQDGGYGGTACDAGPCDVDGTKINSLSFYINPGQGSFAGTVVLDFISIGTEPNVQVVSDVWQDHFDDLNSQQFMGSPSPGLINVVEDSKWILRGDGTGGPWEPVNLLPHNLATLDTIDVSIANGNDKIFFRMRTDVDGTAIRLDLQDVNDMATTAGSITKIITSDWATYEFNFAGSYSDLGYGGTGCSEAAAPCAVDADRIANLIVFVNPGTGEFVGDVEIDYISIGTPLEEDNSVSVLEYGDHFSIENGYVGTGGAFGLSVGDSEFTITGEGADAPYAAVTYSIHDETGPITVDATGNNKVFIRAKSDAPNTLLRVDLQDVEGYVTTSPSLTRLLDSEFSIVELDFTSIYIDAGYGGTPCDETTAPCLVDATMISNVLFYPNPADGGFDGTITIDYVSFGKEMGEDVPRFTDHFDNENSEVWADAPGFTVSESGTEITLTGDGTSGPYTAFSYALTDSESGAPILVDFTTNNKLYVKAKSTVAGVPMRIDLEDANGFVSTEPSTVANVEEEYTVLEFDYSGTYTDGGYGGTACESASAPCPVDGTSISALVVFIDADNGGFTGDVTIDWISTQSPLETIDNNVNTGPLGIDNYADEFDDQNIDNFLVEEGIEVSTTEAELLITGNGTSTPYSPISIELHDDAGPVIVNASANNNKLFVRAKASSNELPLRIDLQDSQNYHTSLAGLTNLVLSDYSVIEYDYTGAYSDGGYGGTSCDAGPCPVDGERIAMLNMYVDPGVGAYDGQLTIDWVSFGQPIFPQSIESTILESSFVFPNPAQDRITVDLNIVAGNDVVIDFIDVTGKLVKQIADSTDGSSNFTRTINTSDLRTGLYLMNIRVDGQLASVNKLSVQ